jgi:uncharacterized protein (TIRG00374 family)
LYFTINPEEIYLIFQEKIRYEFLLAAVLLNVLFWFIWGARLKVLSNAIDKNVKISLIEATKIVIANLFLASITPSMAGGEPIRIYLLNKDGMSIGGSTAVVLGERLIDAIFMIVTVPIAFFIYKDLIENEYLSLSLVIAMLFFIIGILIFVYAIKFPDKTKGFLIAINNKFSRFSKKKESRKKIVEKINSEVDNFHNSMVFFAKEGRKAFLFGAVLTVLLWSTGFMIPSMILLSLDLPPFFIESYMAQLLLLIVVMLPTTPGSSGIAELGINGLYRILLGTSNEYLIGIFVLLFRLITYHMNLIAGAIFMHRIFKSVTSFSMDMIKKQEKE